MQSRIRAVPSSGLGSRAEPHRLVRRRHGFKVAAGRSECERRRVDGDGAHAGRSASGSPGCCRWDCWCWWCWRRAENLGASRVDDLKRAHAAAAHRVVKGDGADAERRAIPAPAQRPSSRHAYRGLHRRRHRRQSRHAAPPSYRAEVPRATWRRRLRVEVVSAPPTPARGPVAKRQRLRWCVSTRMCAACRPRSWPAGVASAAKSKWVCGGGGGDGGGGGGGG